MGGSLYIQQPISIIITRYPQRHYKSCVLHASSISNSYLHFYSWLDADGGLSRKSQSRLTTHSQNTVDSFKFDILTNFSVLLAVRLSWICEVHYTRLARPLLEGYNLLYCLSSTVQVNDTLMDPHFVLVPGLRTFTTRSLTSGDVQDFGRHTDWTLYLQV